MNGATAESAKITNKPIINNTKRIGTSHHFFVSTMNDIISFKNLMTCE